MKISRNKQIIFYLAVLIFGVSFFFYFYKQAAVTEGDFLEVKASVRPAQALVNKENIQIDLTFFNSDKFKNLHSDVVPTQSFKEGKRNPFAPD